MDYWSIEFPDGNPYPDYLTLSDDGDFFTLSVDDASMPIGDYVFNVKIQHLDYADLKSETLDYSIEVLPCEIQYLNFTNGSMFTSDFFYLTGEGLKTWEFSTDEISQEPQCLYTFSLTFNPSMVTDSSSFEFESSNAVDVGSS